MNSLTVPGGLAVALGPHEGVGPLRILLLDPNGGIRTITLNGIESGANYAEHGGRVLTPAITVDHDGGRMYVVAARGLLVAEVELDSGAVSYHSLGASASKGNIDVWSRDAAWIGDGRIAVTGDHWVTRPWPAAVRGAAATRHPDDRHAHVEDLDARSPSRHDHVAGDTVLASGTRWFDGSRHPESTGLLAFDEGGARAFTRFPGRQVVLLGSRGDLGYVWVRRTRTAHIVDMADGRTLNTIRTGRRAPSLLSPSP